MARKKLDRYPNFGAVRQYVDDILGGRKIACKELIQACERFERDLQDEVKAFLLEGGDLACEVGSVLEKKEAPLYIV